MQTAVSPPSESPSKPLLQASNVYSPTSPSPIAKESVESILRSRIAVSEDDGDAFYVCDLGQIARQFWLWKKLLPRVEPFYAVKCNPRTEIVELLHQLGTGFDCASRSELEAVLSITGDPDRIIYANPCKQASHLKYSEAHGVKMLTFDNADELHKIKKYAPSAELIIRVLTDNSRSLCNLGTKFGAPPQDCERLLSLAIELGLKVVGVSFHVGSGCFDAEAFPCAVRVARNVFDIGERLGLNFSILDIGGGFPGVSSEKVNFPQIAALLGPVIDELFPPHIRVISEPGRFFVASAFTLATSITARRSVARSEAKGSDVLNAETPGSDDHPSFMYYINDGMYGSFNCLYFDHATVTPRPVTQNGVDIFHGSLESQQLYECSLWGPTCDSMDVISKSTLLPELHVGDWMIFEEMGAYTMAAATSFNGFSIRRVIFTHCPAGECR